MSVSTGAPELAAAGVDFEDVDEAIEHCYRSGWTDGLPFLLPTERRVQSILSAVDRDPLEVVGKIPPRNGTATIEKIAINAAMAGCLPEHFPVLLAAIEAMLGAEFNLNGVQATTHVCAPLTIVSGPAVSALNFNGRDGVFGGGSRANVGVGRAVRMVLWNLGGAKPGDIDKSTFGHPGKYAFCIAEHPEDNPWEPLHVARDPSLSAEDSAVTVFACEANRNVADTHNDTPQGLLNVIADALRTIGNENTYGGGQVVVVLGPERARVMKQYGWTRKDVQHYLFDQARRSVREMRKAKLIRSTPRWVNADDPDAMWPVFEDVDDIVVLVAGGDGPHSATCSGWGEFGGFAATRKIDFPVGRI